MTSIQQEIKIVDVHFVDRAVSITPGFKVEILCEAMETYFFQRSMWSKLRRRLGRGFPVSKIE